MPSSLRATARGAVMAGALGSTAFTVRAGQQAPRLLLIAIALWVLVPFVTVSIIDLISTHRPPAFQLTLHISMVVLAGVSLAVYGAELVKPHTPPALMFVAVPPLSLLLMAVAVAAAALASRSHR